MFKNIFKIITIFIIGMVGGIFADQIFWPYFVERPLFYQYRLEQAPIYVTERKEIIVEENVALRNAIEKVEKAVVGVKTKTKTGKILEGSGLIVSSDGLVVTLANLVPSGSDITFFWEGKTLSFQILKRDLKENLALIKIEETNLPTTGFVDLERIKLGERVFLMGVIFEKGKVPKKEVNEGIVKTFDENSIQTNIFEKSTFSGSPLFNIEGNALGLNIVDKEGKVTAIPISKIKDFIGF
ncbi:MAG: trypsin-like peptidase domain-containing protein [Candidatus Nealsonbacteria bacterium]